MMTPGPRSLKTGNWYWRKSMTVRAGAINEVPLVLIESDINSVRDGLERRASKSARGLAHSKPCRSVGAQAGIRISVRSRTPGGGFRRVFPGRPMGLPRPLPFLLSVRVRGVWMLVFLRQQRFA